ncbi:MAG TPA: OmpA family protein, partial [Paludibacteraceae bacterium]|nr:OmpA family protein [Paludibacteraceae bacterium]
SDGKTMYFSRAQQSQEKDMGAEIYYSKRAGGSWSTPQRITIFKDSSISVAHPAIAPDGETLYFVSDHPSGFGGKDIYRAVLESGECKYVENLGPSINTPGDEMFPTIRIDGTLYFSSNGHPGFGGLDIFKAVQNKDGMWQIKNMGMPVNSSSDDFGITFEGNAERGYFSSNRNENRGYDAIWSFELPEIIYLLEGKVVDENVQPVPDAKIRIVSNTGVNAYTQTKKDGSYRFKLEKDAEYVMLASARGYLNQQNKLSTMGVQESKTYHVDFKLYPINKPIKIENIFYEFGKWDLTPASEKALQELVQVLKDNPNITIELSSHTDYVGDNQFNKILSEKRAQSVVDYLIKHGIEKERLTAVGYGEEQPVVVDENLVQKYPFLKLGQSLTESYILTLTPEQQEIANQINRRTEFKVLKTTYNLY